MLPERLIKNRRVTETGCWEWTASRTEHGYGRISWQGKVRRVHRLVAHLVHGLDLDDRSVRALHRCDNPPCFNPEHIFVGSQRDNVADMVNKGRWAGGAKRRDACDRGHALTEDNVKPTRSGRARRCRECARESYRAYYQRRKAREGAFWQVARTIRALDGEEPHNA